MFTAFTAILLAIPSRAADLLWLSQSRRDLPQWLYDISALPNGYVLLGLFGPCTTPSFEQKRRTVCLGEDTDALKGRNDLFRHGDEWEQQRGRRFEYFIYTDDNGEFNFTQDCTPSFCGDAALLPQAGELPGEFFQRLLLEEQPAVASPIIVEKKCQPGSMRICTPHIDCKSVAYHWSARGMLARYIEEFSTVSLFAGTTCLLQELLESAFEGYSWVYRMFQRTGNATRFMKHRGHYIRNLHPCLPRKTPEGEFQDSALVSWLRPQLTSCASRNLGPAAELQRGCGGVCQRPPKDVNYSAFPCLPWASIGSEDYCRPKPVGQKPPRSKVWVSEGLVGMLGYGLPDLPEETNSSRDQICRLGRNNLAALARLFHGPFQRKSPHVQALVAAVQDLHREDCHELCSAVIMGAGALAFREGISRASDVAGIRVSCRFAFLRVWSIMDLLGAGWVSLFELAQREAESSWPAAPRFEDLGEIKEILRRIPVQHWQRISQSADEAHWSCDVRTAVELLLQASEDDKWRAGFIHAAQIYLFSCEFETLIHPGMAVVWALVVKLGHMGVNASLPPACGAERLFKAPRRLLCGAQGGRPGGWMGHAQAVHVERVAERTDCCGV